MPDPSGGRQGGKEDKGLGGEWTPFPSSDKQQIMAYLGGCEYSFYIRPSHSKLGLKMYDLKTTNIGLFSVGGSQGTPCGSPSSLSTAHQEFH